MAVRRSVVTFALGALLLCAWMPTPIAPTAQQRPDEDQAAVPTKPFRCTERLRIPFIADVFETAWSPNGTTLAVSWYAKIPSRRSVTGYRENDTIIDTLDVATGVVRPVGVGERPEWSATGKYISYWGPNGDEFRVSQDGRTVAALFPSAPNTRWVSDTLYFFEKDEIRTWSDGVVRTVTHLDREFVARYPSDDVYFSSDAERFALTRYALNGTIKRYMGITRTGAVTPLDDSGASYIEWMPRGPALLLRYRDHLELRVDDVVRSVPIASGTVEGWTPDGQALLLGRVSPTVPAGDTFDTFTVWGGPEPDVTATLPNLIGARAFSPNGQYFTGTSRTGVDSTQLEVYRCGTALGDAETARRDPEIASRRERIAADQRHWVRPAAGPISQFLQGIHTGIDIAAPLGSLVVAADDGVVNEVGWFPPVGGSRVCVLHGVGLESCYYHTSAAVVSVGERVTRGQPIAMIGLTGLTTGPHVHWEAKLFGRVIDPLTR